MGSGPGGLNSTWLPVRKVTLGPLPTGGTIFKNIFGLGDLGAVKIEVGRPDRFLAMLKTMLHIPHVHSLLNDFEAIS